MPEKILVVGGVALGPKAAARCKRLMPDAEITLVDENVFISYGGCGIPYYVSGEIQNLDDLRSTPYHTVRDADFFRDMKGITVRTQTRATAIDRAAKTLAVKNVVTGQEEKLPYDKLVLATGATPRVPPVEGKDLENVLSLTRLEAAGAIRTACQEGKITEAVIVGGGFIGLEAAVALADMWGVKCSVVEMVDQILPGVLSHPVARMAAHDCVTHNVNVYTGEKVLRLEGKDGKVCKVVTDKRELEAQLVVFAAGFIPNGQLAGDAGLDVAPSAPLWWTGTCVLLTLPSMRAATALPSRTSLPASWATCRWAAWPTARGASSAPTLRAAMPHSPAMSAPGP